MREGGPPLLEARNVRLLLPDSPWIEILKGVNLVIHEGEAVGLVGESGSGKSLFARSILGLAPAGSRVEGEVYLGGERLAIHDEKAMRQVRGRQVGVVFQDPGTSLNPVLKVGTQITEVMLAHRVCDRAEARERAGALMHSVGIPDSSRRLSWYPHQFSGGQRQRIALCIALGADPKLLIADEATTGLDVTIARQVLLLLRYEQRQRDLAVLLISHDLYLIARFCDTVNVMYAGTICETGPASEVLSNPLMPYTAALVRSRPSAATKARNLTPVPGTPMPAHRPFSGCPFAPRCDRASDRCRKERPELAEVSPGRQVACFHPLGPGGT